jgi:CO/xanthine dehydrogenase Mo-binding subunit
MSEHSQTTQAMPDAIEEPLELIGYDFGLSRRGFVQILGAGLLIAASAATAVAQQRRGGGTGGGGFRGNQQPIPLDSRLHIGKDGTITVMTGKVEAGQGARAEISQAAAEELRVAVEKIQLIMADTAMVPDDGITAGSGTTPRTLPAVRQACAAARELLLSMAATQFAVPREQIKLSDGVATSGEKKCSYADLASSDTSADAFKKSVPRDASVTAVEQWKVLGRPTLRPNARDIVTGAHHYPADITRPDMLYGKVLRAPAYGSKLTSLDPAAAKAMDGVCVVQDGTFVGVAAPTTFLAKRAIAAMEKTAQWEASPHPSSKTLFDYLRKNARGGVPKNPFEDDLALAKKVLKAQYNVAYVQHAPMEPRAAVAEWNEGKLTVWTSSQNPFGVRRELANAFHIPEDRVRVVIPDFGGGFGGKHTGETAIEAARLAQAAGKPVAVRWTRAEEFTWAYFRPAAAIDVQAGLDDKGMINSWHFVNVNAGNPGIETPYKCDKTKDESIPCEAPPLRHGSYRALASTGNNFARESFIDELADAAGRDPLEFRLAHLTNDRLRAVLEEAAKRFDWSKRRSQNAPNFGVGLACGTEKGSFVAACAAVKLDRVDGTIHVTHVCQAYECGAITNPTNLLAQVQGAIVMGLGPALREEMDFEEGRMQNASFWKYKVPRLEDLPDIDIHLINRPDLPSAGAGETPIIAVAPAIANAVYQACGLRLREMPLKLPKQA